MKRSNTLIAKVSSQISRRLPFAAEAARSALRPSSINRAAAYPEIWQLFALVASTLARHARIMSVAPFYVET